MGAQRDLLPHLEGGHRQEAHCCGLQLLRRPQRLLLHEPVPHHLPDLRHPEQGRRFRQAHQGAQHGCPFDREDLRPGERRVRHARRLPPGQREPPHLPVLHCVQCRGWDPGGVRDDQVDQGSSHCRCHGTQLGGSSVHRSGDRRNRHHVHQHAGLNYFVVPNGFCYTNQCLTTYLTSVTQNKGADFGKLIKEPNMGAPSTGKTCGLANGACATLGAFRLDNVNPLTYQCSTVSNAAAGIPAVCGTTKWTRVRLTTAATAPNLGVPPYTGAVTAATDTMYINTQASTTDNPSGASAGTITRTAWDGQEWPEPRETTGSFVGAPKI